ncbi:helix-turn-helix transcriptional regulator [Kitasatospora sp. NPDC048722]|uniref:helix-turn-helix domain-containing protein n=1 Tax=Kitasatospora sp. NPDC048722 TaxID=3155639 RepID=UPI0033DCC522
MPVERLCMLRDDDVYTAEVDCRHPPRGWTQARPMQVFGLVMVRRGLFLARADGVEQVLDPLSVYVERPGGEHQFAHPCGGDSYTEIVLSEPRLVELLAGDPTVPQGLVFTTPRMTVRQRMLAARARERADAFELTELTLELASEILSSLVPERVAAGLPARVSARRRLVDAARAALAVDLASSLDDLARKVGCSPHHLSRIFRETTGEGLARYRTRLKVARALDRISQGDTGLAALAAESGFADQAHMTNAMRRSVGLTPGALRALLAAEAAGGRAH